MEATYYLFRLLGAPPAFEVPYLIILRRELPFTNATKVLYMERQGMASVRHMLRSLLLHGIPVFVQFDQDSIQNALDVFPDILD